MVVSQNRGTQYRPPYTIVLIMGIPQTVPLIMGNPHILLVGIVACEKDLILMGSTPKLPETMSFRARVPKPDKRKASTTPKTWP